MNKKSFFLGALTGIVLTLAVIFVIVKVNQNPAINDPIKYLEHPVSYENKTQTSFKVIQVLGNAALASEVSDERLNLFLGNTVLLIGADYYTDQIVVIKNPQRIGTYSYTSKADIPLTVPVIDGEQ